MARKRILITGAAGFLGSHLCDRFIKEDYHVIGMDNLITGDLRNIEHCLNWKTLSFIIMMFPSLYMCTALVQLREKVVPILVLGKNSDGWVYFSY